MNIPATSSSKGVLLAIVELGGYPNFTSLYEQLGYEVVVARSMRKALSLLKQAQPAVIVAEFNFQSQFRDRTSNLESLLAIAQRMPNTRIIVFYEKEYAHQLQKFVDRFPVLAALAYPIDAVRLGESLRQIEIQHQVS